MASILFVSSMNGGPWGGSEALWSRAAIRLAREGHRVGCAAFDWPEKAAFWQELRGAGCELFPLPNWGRRKATAIDRLLHEALAKPAQTLAVRRLPFRRFDHVAVSQGAWDEITSQPFRTLDGLAGSYSLAYHSYSEEGTPRRLDDLRRLVRHARLNLFSGWRTREVFSARLGEDPPNASMIHSPLSFPTPRNAPPWPDGSGLFRLVAIGTLHCDTKGQDLLLHALAAERWRSRAWTLSLYGDGPERDRIEALARALGLADRVNLRGRTTDVASALAAAHVLVQPSRVEAVGISVHEALAMARPCVVTRIGDMPRWVREGESGFVAARPDVAEVGDALDRAWNARERLAEMGLHARAEFLARFPADPVGDFTGLLLGAAAAGRA